MAEPALRSMTLAEFLRWEDGTDTRYELIGGVPIRQTRRDDRRWFTLPPTVHGVLGGRDRPARP